MEKDKGEKKKVIKGEILSRMGRMGLDFITDFQTAKISITIFP